MALIDLFFRQTATIKPFIREGNGEPVYGNEETRPCRMQRGKRLDSTYKNPDGEIDEVTANARMFCRGEPSPARSLVTCDGQDSSCCAAS